MAPDPQWPDAVEVINEGGMSPVVLICEHASNHIPAEYRALELACNDLNAHIAWDLGARAVTNLLSSMLDAPAFLGAYSRLLIDLNRPPGSASSIIGVSEHTEIPMNLDISPAERMRRQRKIFLPFHTRLKQHLDERDAQGRDTLVVAIHSFSPTFLGQLRPWHVGVLYGCARGHARRLIKELSASASLCVGDNQPYGINLEDDYTIPVHGDARAFAAILIEIRNDCLGNHSDQRTWAALLAHVLSRLIAKD